MQCRIGGEGNIHLEDGRTINPVADALANDLGGVDKVIKDSLVDGSHSAGDRASVQSLSGTTGSLADDTSLDNDDYGLSAELLLELTNQSLLDTAEGNTLCVGDEQDDGLLVSTELNLAGRGNLQVLELVLELSRASLQVEESLGNLCL